MAIPADRQLSFTVRDTREGEAQDPVQDFAADDLKTQQQLIAELKFLRKENAALKDEIAAKKGELVQSVRIIEIEKERGDFFKDAATKGIKVGDNSAILEIRHQEQINMFKDENGRLRNENNSLRSSRNWMSLVSAIGGAGVGYAICK